MLKEKLKKLGNGLLHVIIMCTIPYLFAAVVALRFPSFATWVLLVSALGVQFWAGHLLATWLLKEKS
jgi:hypothetical protein